MRVVPNNSEMRCVTTLLLEESDEQSPDLQVVSVIVPTVALVVPFWNTWTTVVVDNIVYHG